MGFLGGFSVSSGLWILWAVAVYVTCLPQKKQSPACVIPILLLLVGGAHAAEISMACVMYMAGMSLVPLIVVSKDMTNLERVARLIKYAWDIRREIQSFFVNP